MDEFMLIISTGDYANVSPEDMQKRMMAYMPWMEKMTAEGRYKGGAPLEPGTGRYLKNKSTVLTDGPFLEGKEIIGGYVLIKAKDYEEAVALAKDCPLINHCEIIVRRIGKM